MPKVDDLERDSCVVDDSDAVLFGYAQGNEGIILYVIPARIAMVTVVSVL